MAVELYRWQKECLKVWKENNHRGIINVITGAGKTVFAMACIQSVLDDMSREKDTPVPYEDLPLRVMIIVPTIPLALQWGTVLRRWFPKLTHGSKSLGYYYGEVKSSPDCRFMVYVINSARYSLARHAHHALKAGNRVLLIADECHHYGSEENRKVFDFIRENPDHGGRLYTIGLSATPQNVNFESVLVPALGPQIYEYSFHEALRDKNITPFALLQVGVTFTPEENAEYQRVSRIIRNLWLNLVDLYPELSSMDPPRIQQFLRNLITRKGEGYESADQYLNNIFIRAGITRMAEARTTCALDLCRRMPLSSRILVFCERIDQAEKLTERFQEFYGSSVQCYHSKIDREQRARILSAFREGEIHIIVCCHALDEGLDVPDASIGIVMASTSTSRQRIQRLGRILRKSEGKPLATLYYIYVRNSTDPPVYLSKNSPARISDIRFLMEEKNYIHDAYENLAHRVFEEMVVSPNTNAEQIQEVRVCIDEGLLLPDWMLDPADYAPIIQRTQGRHMKNYWIIMKKIAVKAQERAAMREEQ